jgi:hypothetical protein
MKKTTIRLTNAILIIAITLTSLFYSCSKDNSSSSTPTAPSASGLAAGKCQISCSYSGAVSGSYTSMEITSAAAKTSTHGTLSAAGVNGMTPLNCTMTQPFSQTGKVSYKTLGSGLVNTITFSVGGKGWIAVPGDDFTIEIAKNDGAVLEATFSGTLKNDADKTTITLTNGKIVGKY